MSEAATALPTASPAPPGRPEPKWKRERFECSCGTKFTRKTRLGIWSKCPNCGAHAYGRRVLEDIARRGARNAIAEPPKSTKRKKGAPATPPAKPSGGPVVVLEGEPPPAPGTPSEPPRPASRPGLFARITGYADEDDDE